MSRWLETCGSVRRRVRISCRRGPWLRAWRSSARGVAPMHERPRERLTAQGTQALTERELVALVLRNGAPGESVLDLAASLLAEFGSLRAMAAARAEELAQRSGIGPAKAAALVAASPRARIYSLYMPVLTRWGVA